MFSLKLNFYTPTKKNRTYIFVIKNFNKLFYIGFRTAIVFPGYFNLAPNKLRKRTPNNKIILINLNILYKRLIGVKIL